MERVKRVVLLAAGLLLIAAPTWAADIDEFRVKREAVFEFAQKPQATRQGDRVTIAFETKGLCDVTVAIEDADGKIIRHLVSGVLGPNAPEPFQMNTKRQSIVWDGKDDQGVYVDDTEKHAIRVSLGLKPEYERSFEWSPYRRMGGNIPAICPAAEGVYVFEGYGFDHLRLFDHEGKYVRTIYPFPADKVDQVRGVRRHVMPQSGKDLPLKWGFRESTLLTSGTTGIWNSKTVPSTGAGTTAMAVGRDRIFLPCRSLNRMATDGSTGGLSLEGPQTGIRVVENIVYRTWRDQFHVDMATPRSAALSPDSKTLYYTGFGWDHGQDFGGMEWLDGVARMDPLSNDTPQAFVGTLKQGRERGTEFGGSDNAHFKTPTSVAVDAQGRVYVADHANDRIQVFRPDGGPAAPSVLVKSIPVRRPADVAVHQKTGDIYVFSWLCQSGHTPDKTEVPAVMRHLGPLPDAREISSCPLPLRGYNGVSNQYYDRVGGLAYRAALDSWTDPPTIWLVPGAAGYSQIAARSGSADTSLVVLNQGSGVPWKDAGILLLTEKGGKLEVQRNFGKEADKVLLHLEPAICYRQRLYANPKTGILYVSEGDDAIEGKSFHELIEIDPATGQHKLVQLPFNAEDLAFDMDGLLYLRSNIDIVRYDPATWKEVPFDYGVEKETVGYGGAGPTRWGSAIGAIGFDTTTAWHQGGIGVSPKGNIVASFYYEKMKENRHFGEPEDKALLRPYIPTQYPGRGGTAVVQVWDKYGHIIAADAIPGIGVTDGIAMDKNNDLYVLAATARILDGTRYFDYMTGTAIKFRLGKAKMITTNDKARIPLTPGDAPKRPQELERGSIGPAWAEGAQWFYGGLAYAGRNASHAAGGCACWNARFCLDYFARSFVPETQHYSVGVLDTNGNLILRVGRYGNVDDGKPLVGEGGPSNPRSIGGDEVGLFYPAYLATDTDHRLFVADPGNSRIVAVKLGYHATARVALKDVAEGQK